MQAVTGYEPTTTSGVSSTANAQQRQQQQQMESSPSRPFSSNIPRSSTWKHLPDAWVYYVVTDVGGVHVPLAAMHRLGRSTDFLRDAASVCSMLTDSENREMLELEKDLAEDYYKSTKARPPVAELRDYKLEFSMGFISFGGQPRYAEAHGLREFPHTSACLRKGAESTCVHGLSWCGGVPRGAEGWRPVPLGTVRRVGNRTYALMVWDISDLDNVKHGVSLNKNDAEKSKNRAGINVQRGLPASSWYPMSAADAAEHVHASGGVPYIAELGFDKLSVVESRVLRYICGPDIPPPTEIRAPPPSPPSLWDQTITTLLDSVDTLAHFDTALLEQCRRLPGFKQNLRRVLGQRSRPLPSAGVLGHVLAVMFEDEADINLLVLPSSISLTVLNTLLESEFVKAASSLTLFAQSIQAEAEVVARVLMEGRPLDIRILRKPDSASPDPGSILFEQLLSAAGRSVGRQRRIVYTGEDCALLGLDLPEAAS